MGHRYWPLFDLRVRTPSVELRLPTDDDLVELASLAAEGVHDPAVMPFETEWTDLPSPEMERGVLQWNWRQRAEWTPEAWHLPLVAERDGRVVGVQDVWATGFARYGSVLTGSWIGLAHQGRGFGTEMRAAVLHLAFDGLRAREARTAAWADNRASQAVTDKLGYEPLAETLGVRRGRPHRQVWYRLAREQWAEGRRDDIEVAALDGARDLFASPDPTGPTSPDPPSALVAGVDGCRGGWAVATMAPFGPASLEISVCPDFESIMARVRVKELATVGVDMPIGLAASGPRTCDTEARQTLRARRASVFPALPRAALDAADYDDAKARARAATGKALSRQSFALLAKIGEIDAAIAPSDQSRVAEMHPEVCFSVLAGAPMAHPKCTTEGRTARLAVLRPLLPAVDELAESPPAGAAADDVIDACVLALAARELAVGTVTRLGDGARDQRGLLMEVVAPASPTPSS